MNKNLFFFSNVKEVNNIIMERMIFINDGWLKNGRWLIRDYKGVYVFI